MSQENSDKDYGFFFKQGITDAILVELTLLYGIYYKLTDEEQSRLRFISNYFYQVNVSKILRELNLMKQNSYSRIEEEESKFFEKKGREYAKED